MSSPFKVCPECAAEYVPTAVSCADCTVALVVAPSGPAAPVARSAEELPPAAELTRIATGGPWEMERLAVWLQEAGFSSRVDALLPDQPAPRRGAAAAPRGSARLALYVRPDDVRDAQLAIQQLIDQEGSAAPAAGEATGSLDACPACGASITATASACADCGLEFVPLEATCATCGAVLDADATACAACGARAPRDRAG